MWNEGAGAAAAVARPFMAALAHKGGARRAERGQKLLITDPKDVSPAFPFERRGTLVLATATGLTASGALAQSAYPQPVRPPRADRARWACSARRARRSARPREARLDADASAVDQNLRQGSGLRQEFAATRDFGQAADQPPTLAIAVYQMSNEDRRIARFLLPVGLLLKPGFRLIIDKVTLSKASSPSASPTVALPRPTSTTRLSTP